MNQDLFIKYPQAETEYNETSTKQTAIKRQFFSNIEEICSTCEDKEYYICSDKFKDFYIDRKYHYGENPNDLITHLKREIEQHNL